MLFCAFSFKNFSRLINFLSWFETFCGQREALFGTTFIIRSDCLAETFTSFFLLWFNLSERLTVISLGYRVGDNFTFDGLGHRNHLWFRFCQSEWFLYSYRFFRIHAVSVFRGEIWWLTRHFSLWHVSSHWRTSADRWGRFWLLGLHVGRSHAQCAGNLTSCTSLYMF